jgi:hypothetical protein
VTPFLQTVFLNTKIIHYRKMPVFGDVNKIGLETLKVQATKCSDTSGSNCPAAHCHIPEDWNACLPGCGNFKTSCTVPYSFCYCMYVCMYVCMYMYVCIPPMALQPPVGQGILIVQSSRSHSDAKSARCKPLPDNI